MGLFRRTSAGLLLLGGIPAVILWLWSVPLFRFVFGSQWALSGAIAGIIAPWYLADFVVSPVSRVVLVLSGQETKLGWDVLSLGSLLTVFWVAQARGMAPLHTIRILTVVNTALRLVYYLILISIIARFQGVRGAEVQAV